LPLFPWEMGLAAEAVRACQRPVDLPATQVVAAVPGPWHPTEQLGLLWQLVLAAAATVMGCLACSLANWAAGALRCTNPHLWLR
jgi:hypothetical protein